MRFYLYWILTKKASKASQKIHRYTLHKIDLAFVCWMVLISCIYMNRVLNEARERRTQQNPIQSNQFLMSVFVTFCHFCVLHLWLVRNWPINHSREPLNSPSFRHVYMYVWWYIIYKYIIHVDVIIWYIYIQGRQENTGKITQFATYKLYDNTYYIYKYDYDE